MKANMEVEKNDLIGAVCRYNLFNTSGKLLGAIDIDVRKNYVYIHLMQNVTLKEENSYTHVGEALHEIVLRLCYFYNKESIQLEAANAAYLFHYQYGFRYPDNTAPFPWFRLPEKFINDPHIGKQAYLIYRSQLPFPNSPAANSFNDVLDFYFLLHINSKNSDERLQIREGLRELGAVSMRVNKGEMAKRLNVILSNTLLVRFFPPLIKHHPATPQQDKYTPTAKL
jgi:hypothetical protein